MAKRPVQWFERNYDADLHPNAGGILDTFTIPVPGTVVRAILQVSVFEYGHPAGGTGWLPSTVSGVLQGRDGFSANFRTLYAVAPPMQYNVNIYNGAVPPPAVEILWYATGVNELYFDQAVALGGPGHNAVELQTIISSYSPYPSAATGIQHVNGQLRYLVME